MPCLWSSNSTPSACISSIRSNTSWPSRAIAAVPCAWSRSLQYVQNRSSQGASAGQCAGLEVQRRVAVEQRAHAVQRQPRLGQRPGLRGAQPAAVGERGAAADAVALDDRHVELRGGAGSRRSTARRCRRRRPRPGRAHARPPGRRRRSPAADHADGRPKWSDHRINLARRSGRAKGAILATMEEPNAKLALSPVTRRKLTETVAEQLLAAIRELPAGHEGAVRAGADEGARRRPLDGARGAERPRDARHRRDPPRPGRVRHRRGAARRASRRRSPRRSSAASPTSSSRRG